MRMCSHETSGVKQMDEDIIHKQASGAALRVVCTI